MINPQLFEYVKQQLSQGINKENIINNLKTTGGWKQADIDEVFETLAVDPNFVPVVPIAIPVDEANVLKYAGFWVRFAAAIVDGFIINISTLILNIILMLALGSKNQGYSILSLVCSFGVLWGYNIWLINSYQATLGKKWMGIKVVSESDGEKLPLGKIIIRETIGKFVSTIIFGIGYFMAAFTKKKQALHDEFAGSVVVYTYPSKKNTATIVIAVICVLLFCAVIFGILSAVVLASLSSAKVKAVDASTRANITSYIIQARVFAATKNSLNGFVANSPVPTSISVSGCDNSIESKISPDFQKIAVFGGSCLKPGTFLCQSFDLGSSTSSLSVVEVSSTSKDQINYDCSL